MKVKKRRKELCLLTLDWQFKQLQEKEENGTITDDEKARLALMLEASGVDLCVSSIFLQYIPLQPLTTTTESIKVDDSDKVPDDPDYSQVKIKNFGFLRGIGFKEKKGIGETTKLT